MKDDEKMFLRTLCIVSATMASISFVGVSIILSIYFNLSAGIEESIKKGWLQVANTGVLSVFLFSFTTFCILIAMFPKVRGEEAPKSVITQKTIKRGRIHQIFRLIQRVKTKISKWGKENVLGLLLLLFMLSWVSFFAVMFTLIGAFNV